MLMYEIRERNINLNKNKKNIIKINSVLWYGEQ
jgi:hypothetical protein